jgi:tetratricopeptide (TPR) repeat protein
MDNLDETTPIETGGDETQKIEAIRPEENGGENGKPKPRRRIVRMILLGLAAVLVLGALGSLGGYLAAIQDRERHQSAIVSTEVTDQFLLGLIEFERGQYELARQRFEYIMRIDPGNTAAAEKLTETILKLNQNSAPPTEVPTPTVSPTPDIRSQEELFQAALQYRNVQDWDNLLTTLDSLRFKDPSFNSVQVDGMYFLAYRNRGMQRITVQGNLEGGIFDLNRAELFGPLDVDARNYREWASKYITAVSFWEVDWNEVVNYLGPLAISAPFLSDSNFFTVQDRLATAQIEVNYQILTTARSRYAGQKWCDAYDLYTQASAYIQLPAGDAEKLEDARNRCFGIEPTPEVTPTPEDGGEGGG